MIYIHHHPFFPPVSASRWPQAWSLLRQWEQDNVALRAEARLTSAVERVHGGFNSAQPEAADVHPE